MPDGIHPVAEAPLDAYSRIVSASRTASGRPWSGSPTWHPMRMGAGRGW
jgi:hypothetical protein